MKFTCQNTNMHKLKYLSLVLIVSFMLAGCAGQKLDTLSVFQRMQIKITYLKVEQLLEKDRPNEAVQVLWKAAASTPPPHRQSMQVHAVEILLNHSRSLKAYRYLVKIDETPLVGRTLLRKRLAEARFYAETAQYQKVLSVLPIKLINQGNKTMKISALRLTAVAWAETGGLVKTISSRMFLHRLLDKPEHADNIKHLWRALLLSDPQKNLQEQEKKYPPHIKNWLNLAVLATPETIDIPSLNQQFEDWQRRNKQWPLPESIHAELLSRWQYLDFTPRHITVLLPLTGAYAKIGRMVQKGFLAEHKKNSTPDFTVQFYNTDTEKSTLDLYQKAVSGDGTDMVIGPLLKLRVNELLTSTAINVPTITLNYAQVKTDQHNEAFQFGLLPEDEAIQIAQKVWENGHRFALTLAPKTEWGQRMYTTFTTHYTELGGVVRDSLHYDPTFVDYSVPIEHLFRLNESNQRYENVVKTLRREVQFVPRIRDDAEAAVLFSNSDQAVLIYPQMKYHYADKFPVYASSHIYKPDSKKKNRDLDGIFYCDAPIIFDYDSDIFETPEQEALIRMFALGADAYQLIGTFRQMNIARRSFDGMTGKLSIKNRQKFFRQLEWGNFSYGKPKITRTFR